MRHAKPYRKLSRQRSHYRALMRNLALALFQQERVNTTIAKAKEVRRFVDKILTLAKSGTLHDRRRANALLGNIRHTDSKTGEQTDPLQKVFTELGPRYKTRPGGFTRIIKTGFRAGDAAPMCIFELVDGKVTKGSEEAETKEKKVAKKPTTKKKATKASSSKKEAA